MIRNHQKGVTLIIVLFALLLVTILGVLSVRQSTTDLAISTSAQVDDLLFQGSDAAFAKVEATVRQSPEMLDNKDSVIGTVLEAEDGITPKDTEVVLCVRPQKEQLFYPDELTKKPKSGGTTIDAGYCNLKDSEHYSSKRQATVTQMILLSPTIPPERVQAFQKQLKLTCINSPDLPDCNDIDGDGAALPVKPLCAYAVTVLPSYTNVALGDPTNPAAGTVHHCLKQPIYGSNSVASCLENIGVPFHYHVQEYERRTTLKFTLDSVSTSTTCPLAG